MNDQYPVGFGDELRNRFRYNKESGLLERLDGRSDKQAWKPVTAKHPYGHLLANMKFGEKNYMISVARVAFFLVEGRWPAKILYKDGDNKNTRWENLVEEREHSKLHKKEVVMETVQVGLPKEEKRPKGRPPSLETVEKRTLSHVTFSGDDAIRNMQLAQQENQELLREMKKYEDAVPFFGELDKLNAALYEEEKRTRWSQGCYTGMTRYELMTFFEEANSHSEAVYTRREAAKMYVQAVESGQLSSLEKFDHDRLQAGAWLDLLDRGIMSGTDIDERLAEYTWEGKIVRDACKVRKEAKVKELLAKHGFSSYEEAQKKAHDIFVAEQRKRQEEEARLLRQEEREAS